MKIVAYTNKSFKSFSLDEIPQITPRIVSCNFKGMFVI